MGMVPDLLHLHSTNFNAFKADSFIIDGINLIQISQEGAYQSNLLQPLDNILGRLSTSSTFVPV